MDSKKSALLVLALGGLVLSSSAACGSRAPLASPAVEPAADGPPGAPGAAPPPGVLPYEAVAPETKLDLPRAVALPPPSSVPLPADFFPRHLPEGDRAGPDAVAAVELFELAMASPQPPAGTPLEGALFACRARGFDPKHRFDWFGKPELLVRLTLGSTPFAARSSKQDRPVRIFTVPGVSLKKGEGLRFEVWDRDVTDKELMARREPVFDGKLPLKIKARYASLECAVVPAAEVDRRAEAARGQTDAALGRLERQDRTNAPELDWGLPRELLGDARFSLRGLAAQLGWRHPLVQERTRRLEHWHARWDLAARAHVNEFLRRLPPTGEWVEPDDRLAVQVVQWRCEVPDRGTCPSGIDCDRDCTVLLEVRNRSEAPLVPDGGYDGLGRYGTPWVVLEDGTTRSAGLWVLPQEGAKAPTATAPTKEPAPAPVAAPPATAAAPAPAPPGLPPRKTIRPIPPGAVGRVQLHTSLLRGHQPMPRLIWFTSTDLLLPLVAAPSR